jgi:hypothetical protein
MEHREPCGACNGSGGDIHRACHACKGAGYIKAEKRETWIKPGDEDRPYYAKTILWNALVGCKHNIVDGAGGGIKCTKCGGWFCL